MWKDEQGNTWYRGNLHTHTQRSDGKLSYEEAVALYRKAGYDFLAITDHWKWSEAVQEENFLLLPGCEYDVGSNGEGNVYHIVGVGCAQDPGLTRETPDLSPQKFIDAIHANGGLAILAHPAWSMNRVDKVLELHDIDGTEIYNTFSGVLWNRRAYSGEFVDTLATAGRLLPCMAADDTHQYVGEEARSYLMVKAPELSREAIMAALGRGDYFATQGPMIRLQIQDRTAIVDCSEAVEVAFFSNAVWTSTERVVTGQALTHVEYKIQPWESYIRVEVMDADGNMAWSSPVPV